MKSLYYVIINCTSSIHVIFLLILRIIAQVQSSIFSFKWKIWENSCCIFNVVFGEFSPIFLFVCLFFFFGGHIWTQILFGSIFLNNFSKILPWCSSPSTEFAYYCMSSIRCVCFFLSASFALLQKFVEFLVAYSMFFRENNSPKFWFLFLFSFFQPHLNSDFIW